jgi:hypothetical protein
MMLTLTKTPPAARSAALEQLIQRVQALETGPTTSRPPLQLDTTWRQPEGDAVHLALGVVHEWFTAAEGPASHLGNASSPPLLLFAHLARLALGHPGQSGLLLWIGRSVWPSVSTLACAASDDGLSDGAKISAAPLPPLVQWSIFLDPPDLPARLWAIDVALRSEAVRVVVADGGGIDLAQSRRLQLAAQTGQALALLARPQRELAELSCAATRWLVKPRPSESKSPQWELSCLRCKGVQRLTAPEASSQLFLEWDRATGRVRVAPRLVDRSGAAANGAFAFRRSAAAS